MKTTPFIATVILVLVAPSAIASNPSQSGTGGDCLNDIVTFAQGSGVPEVIAARVTIAPETGYTISGPAGDTVYIDFFDEFDGWVAWNAGAPSGTVPWDAAYGIVCLTKATASGIPVAPDTTGTWTYTDGF
jgi:hypothetical protein